MPRVRKGSARTQARKKMLRQARGYFGTNSRHWYRARNAVIRGRVYAFRDRRYRKRDYRQLWIVRVTAACEMRGTRYSRFMDGIKRAGIILNRKMLAEVAIHDPKLFDKLVELSNKHAKAMASKH